MSASGHLIQMKNENDDILNDDILNDDILFIGIDPSINSTGIVIRLCDSTLQEKWIKYYILKGDSHKVTKKTGKPVSPLTRAECTAQEQYEQFQYILYDKHETNSKNASVENELAKTMSFISLIEKLKSTISSVWETSGKPDMYIVIEGISYGSTTRTSSVFDLAGLNYMIRTAMIDMTNNLIISPPTYVKKFATGMGNANKELIISTFKTIYPDFDIPKIDDIADAFFMSRLAQRYYENKEF